MTPLVREMAALVPETETAHWFDLGTVPSHVPAGRTAWDNIRHMPYPRTVAVFASDKGAKYACWIAAGQYSVTFAYLMAVPSGGARYSMALNITVEDGEMRYTTSDAHASDADRKDALRMLAITVQRLQTASAAYRPESIGTPAQQRKRAAKGKKPLFAWHTVTISATPKVAVATPDVAGTHASPRAHDRRGHWRIYKASACRLVGSVAASRTPRTSSWMRHVPDGVCLGVATSGGKTGGNLGARKVRARAMGAL